MGKQDESIVQELIPQDVTIDIKKTKRNPQTMTEKQNSEVQSNDYKCSCFCKCIVTSTGIICVFGYGLYKIYSYT